jgi:hypothetical protein
VCIPAVKGEAGRVTASGRRVRAGIAHAQRPERYNDRHYVAAHRAHVCWAAGH